MAATGFNRPQRRRTLQRVSVAFLVILSILIILADKQERSLHNSGRYSLDDPSAKVLSFIAAPARNLTKFVAGLQSRKSLAEDNEQLRAEIYLLKQQNADMVELKTRLRKYEAMLGSDVEGEKSRRRIAARAVNERGGPFVHTALLNIGADDGAKPGFAVMTEDGYWGYLVRVGDSSSRVLLANDLSSRIAVKSARTGARAIMVGTNGRSPVLRFMDTELDWLDGDQVQSSGDDGHLPAGLQIGTARKTNKLEFIVELDSARKPVDWVFVSVFEPIIAPIELPPDIPLDTPNEIGADGVEIVSEESAPQSEGVTAAAPAQGEVAAQSKPPQETQVGGALAGESPAVPTGSELPNEGGP